jgi:hypothetical protein
MSIQKMAEVWKFSRNGGSLLLVEIAIADHINGAGLAWPSVKHLAKKTKLSERQIHRLIKQLEKSGELIVLRDRYYNRYQINLSDNMSSSDKLSCDMEHKSDAQVIKDDTQVQEDDTQVQEDDTQGLKGDTDVTLIINNHHKTINGIIKEDTKFLKDSLITASLLDSPIVQKDGGEEIWEKLLNVLKVEKSIIFDKLNYFQDVSLNDDTLTVWVPTIYQRDFCNDRFVKLLERSLIGIVTRKMIVRFDVQGR